MIFCISNREKKEESYFGEITGVFLGLLAGIVEMRSSRHKVSVQFWDNLGTTYIWLQGRFKGVGER